MKKKLIALLSAVTVFLAVSIPAFAESSDTIREVEYYDDGTYGVIETIIEDKETAFFAASTTKSASRTYTYYRTDGKAAWDFSVKGTFTYNGSTAKATRSTTSYHIYVTGWSCSSRNGTVSGSTAKGTGTFKYKSGLSKTITLGLKCSAKGVISAV